MFKDDFNEREISIEHLLNIAKHQIKEEVDNIKKEKDDSDLLDEESYDKEVKKLNIDTEIHKKRLAQQYLTEYKKEITNWEKLKYKLVLKNIFRRFIFKVRKVLLKIKVFFYFLFYLIKFFFQKNKGD
jgi:predicted  nucleic acid-binding Zn-ribbon protein